MGNGVPEVSKPGGTGVDQMTRKKIRRSVVWLVISIILAVTGTGTYIYEKLSTSTVQVQRVAFYSKALQKQMKVDIYLPPGYSKHTKYPVLFFFHGKDSNENTAFTSLHLNTVANRLIQQGKIRPLVIVSPEIDNSYGVNSAHHTYTQDGYSYGQYETYIEQELFPYVSTHYSISSKRVNRFIGGFSMGGFVAIHIALLHPSEFSKVGGHSAALWVNPNTVPALLMKQTDRQIFGLARTQNLSGLTFYLDHGTSGVPYFAQGESKLAEILRLRHIAVQLHTGPGRHDNAYWRANAAKYLLFYAGKG